MRVSLAYIYSYVWSSFGVFLPSVYVFCFAISFPCSQGARVTGTLAYALEGIYLEIPIDADKMTRHQFRAVLISIDS